MKLKLEHVVCLNRSDELNPSLDVAKSNCSKLSSNWCPPMTIEVLGFSPPLTNPRHKTSSFTCTIEFAPKILQYVLSFCNTRSMLGTEGPTRVLSTLSVLKQTSNGATAAALVMFMAADSVMKASVTALNKEASRTV